jgi:hypothetical protein
MIADKPISNRPSILRQMDIIKAKFTEAKVSQMRAFVCRLGPDDIEWLKANSGADFEMDLLRLRDRIDLLLNEAVPDGPRERAVA